MPRIFHNHHVQICAGLIVADAIIFTGVNPRNASAAWLIAGYILLGVTLFGLANMIASGLRGYGEAAHAVARRFMRYGAATAVVLIGLQSIGQLTLKDVAALLPLVALAYLYFGYGKTLQPKKT